MASNETGGFFYVILCTPFTSFLRSDLNHSYNLTVSVHNLDQFVTLLAKIRGYSLPFDPLCLGVRLQVKDHCTPYKIKIKED